MSPQRILSSISPGTRFGITAVLLLYLSFGHNLFQAVNPLKFHDAGGSSESLVIARMAETRENGLSSHQARMGKYMRIDGELETDASLINSHQMQRYLGQLDKGEYEPYDSQFGLQGILFSLLDSGFDELGVGLEHRHRLYISLVALTFALVLTILMLMLYKDIGLTACVLILASIIFSRWQVYFAKNMYFMLPFMFFPMLAVFYACRRESAGRSFNLALVSLLVMLLVMFDALMGYEYISTIMLATVTPLVYFWIRDGWNRWLFAKRFVVIGFFALVGFIAALTLHAAQLELAYGSFEDAFEVIKERILVRTYTDPEDYAGTPYYESQTTSVFYVLYVYLLKGGTFRLKLPFLLWILMLAHITRKVHRGETGRPASRLGILRTLIMTSWFALLAPLSWIVLAKSHSEIHTHINYIVWHLPFMFFVFALFGVYWEKQLNASASRLWGKLRRRG